MKVIEKFQCSLCGGVWDQAAHAQQCERKHIELNDVQVVRAVHAKGINQIDPPEGCWPTALIVGVDKFPDKLMRYKFDDEELLYFGDPYYETGGDIKR